MFLLGSTIQQKLLFGFAVILLLLIAVGGLGFFTAHKVNDGYSFLIEDRVEKVDILDDMMITHAQIVGDARGFFLYGDNVFMDSVSSKGDELKALGSTLQQLIVEPENKALMEEIQAARESYIELLEKALVVHKEGDMDTFNKYAADAGVSNAMFLEKAHTLKDIQEKALEQSKAEINQVVKSSNLWNVLLVIISIVAGLTVAYLANRSISGPIRRTTDALEQLADGNLRIEPVKIIGKDEISQMGIALNTMLGTWNGVVKQINDSATELAAQSEELSASSEESLASSQMIATTSENHLVNSEEQLDHVIQSTASLSEMNIGMTQIATSNEDMLTSANDMSELIDKGIVVVRDVSVHMDDIHATIQESTNIMEVMAERSVEIQQVSALITNISEQTNLLALNAAIEAARAGENGKGFAVVADEVRKLAEESKISATKIEEMINDILTSVERAVSSIQSGKGKVTEGLDLSAQSLSVFGAIESSVDNVEEKIGAVSAAIQEIQAMSDNVASGSEHMKKMTELSTKEAQEASAATEEQLAVIEGISTSTETLARLAEDLQMEVKKFRV